MDEESGQMQRSDPAVQSPLAASVSLLTTSFRVQLQAPSDLVFRAGLTTVD